MTDNQTTTTGFLKNKDALIGQKVDGTLSIAKNGQKYQSVTPQGMQELKNKIQHDEVRVIMSGYAYTMDFRQNRINVKIDENFVITEVYMG